MNAANPPTLFLAVEELLNNGDILNDVNELKTLFDRLELWFQWMHDSQQSEHDPKNFYWKGRSSNEDARELNPKTLTSGLDDYPRASHPDFKERHIDMRCWLAFGAKAMARIAKVIAVQDNHSEDVSSYQKKWNRYEDLYST